ncbi:hypothetical protein SDC9_176878 [bioreactor metagenome]|uniref:Uncharacterized protein n=1 Tax=bioreactor metagenome TaxID=1076179 RepID=A0A645GRQ8_9ZZZZ
MRLHVFNYGGDGGFRAGSGRGGYGEHRGQFVENSENAAHLFNRFVVCDARGRDLRAIHRRTAAKGDKRAAPIVKIQLPCFLNVFDGGVGLHAVVDGVGNAALVKSLEQGVEQTEALDDLIGHNQHTEYILLFNFGG